MFTEFVPVVFITYRIFASGDVTWSRDGLGTVNTLSYTCPSHFISTGCRGTAMTASTPYNQLPLRLAVGRLYFSVVGIGLMYLCFAEPFDMYVFFVSIRIRVVLATRHTANGTW